MTSKTHPTNNYLCFNSFKPFGFGVLKQETDSELAKSLKISLTHNMMLDFVISAYNYAKIVFEDYSSIHSKKTYTQPQLFAIIAYKIYNKFNYRTTIENLELSNKLREVLDLKTIPHFTTLQKFFKNMNTEKINKINKKILKKYPVKNYNFILDGTGFTNSYSDIYYNTRTNKTRRQYIKNHITIDSKYMLIRHYNALKGPRFDSIFAIPAIRSITKYEPKYIIADRAYDSEEIKKTIVEETTALPQIPVKTRQKKGKYRSKCRVVFNKKEYNQRNMVESVNSIIKKIFSGINNSRTTELQIKETKLKNVLYNIYREIKIIEK